MGELSGSQPVLSVRGEASRLVAPDVLTLHCPLVAAGTGRAAALRAAAEQLARLTGDLAGLGAVPLTARGARSPLTWSAQATSTQPEHEPDATGQWRPTGRVLATVSLVLTCRDLDLVEPLLDRLARHDGADVSGTSWAVDADNPAWAEVRGEAVHAALRAARDFASALGGTVRTLDHLADAGLLGEGPRPVAAGRMAGSPMAFMESGGTPSLDPVPQPVAVTVEARFTATGVSL